MKRLLQVFAVLLAIGAMAQTFSAAFAGGNSKDGQSSKGTHERGGSTP